MEKLGEKIPLINADDRDDLAAAYGMGWHATWVKTPHSEVDSLTDYEPLKFSSFRVCCMRRGTIMESPVIIVEQLILFLIFFCAAAPVYYFFASELSIGKEAGGQLAGVSVSRFINKQEPKMRQFAMIMTGLSSFLLTFYTSIIVARWWTMRTGGVGGIKKATVDLELLLYQAVTQDKDVLSAVRRYGRTSLFLIFMWRREETKDTETLMQMLMQRGLLNKDECDHLVKWGKHCLHETIWAWQMAIVNKLHQQGKVSSDPLYKLLLDICLEGRSAVQLVHTHLAVRMPIQYVHALGLLVKMHNFVLAVIMGLLFGAAVRNQQWILCTQLCARLFILPFLFNAILLINCDLADPFNGGESDFPGDVYQANLGKDCKGMMGATQNVPAAFQLKNVVVDEKVMDDDKPV